jgi:hypothetical protein
LAKLNRANLANISDFEFIVKWNTLDEQEKHKTFTKMISHELNVFLYFKDPKYFKEVVGPFIRNKMEKTFIDYFLLDDKKQIREYLQISSKSYSLTLFRVP